MAVKKVFAQPEAPAANPVIYDEEICIGCNRCIEACQVDIFLPNPVKGKPPIVQYPGECWYCGCCVMDCPCQGAIALRHPLMNQVHWERKKNLLKK